MAKSQRRFVIRKSGDVWWVIDLNRTWKRRTFSTHAQAVAWVDSELELWHATRPLWED